MKKDTQAMPEEIWAKKLPDGAIYDPHGNADRDATRYIRADITIQQKPAVLEGERAAALKFIDMWREELIQMEGFDSREGVVATIKSALQSSAVEAVSFDEAFDSVHAYFRQQNSVLSFHKAQTDMVIRALVAANLLKLKDLKIITDITEE